MSVSKMPAGAADPSATEEKGAKGAKIKKMVVIGLAVVVLGGGVWYQFLRPKPEGPPVPGEVMALEPIQINLAGGHYLRVGLALQLKKGAYEVDGSKALDATIGTFSGLPVGEVSDPDAREKFKSDLVQELDERYHGDVMEVYFTEFVTQ